MVPDSLFYIDINMKCFELKRLFFTLLGMVMTITAQCQLSFTSPTTLYEFYITHDVVCDAQ